MLLAEKPRFVRPISKSETDVNVEVGESLQCSYARSTYGRADANLATIVAQMGCLLLYRHLQQRRCQCKGPADADAAERSLGKSGATNTRISTDRQVKFGGIVALPSECLVEQMQERENALRMRKEEVARLECVIAEIWRG